MWAWVKLDPTALRYVALSPHAKDMAENMYRALWSWLVCVVVTVVVSLVTKPKPDSELNGLVYGLTAIPHEAEMSRCTRSRFSGRRGGGRVLRDSEHHFLVGGQERRRCMVTDHLDLVLHRHFACW